MAIGPMKRMTVSNRGSVTDKTSPSTRNPRTWKMIDVFND
jgi:hypothetical protein